METDYRTPQFVHWREAVLSVLGQGCHRLQPARVATFGAIPTRPLKGMHHIDSHWLILWLAKIHINTIDVRRQRKDECGYGGDGGETENERERMIVDMAEMEVKHKTKEKG